MDEKNLILNNPKKYSRYNLLFFKKASPFSDEILVLNQNNSIQWHEKEDLVMLECPIQNGFPKPVIKWEYNLNNINITKNSDFNILKNKTLVINKFDNNLNGIYTCNSTNEYGSEVFKYRLYLAGKLFPFIFQHLLNTSESPALFSLFFIYILLIE